MAVSKHDHRKPKPRSRQSIEKQRTRRVHAPGESLVTFFAHSPLAEAMAAGELDLERDRDEIRDLAL